MSKCKLARLFDGGMHIVFEDGIEQSVEISYYVNNLTWITSRDEFFKLLRRKIF